MGGATTGVLAAAAGATTGAELATTVAEVDGLALRTVVLVAVVVVRARFAVDKACVCAGVLRLWATGSAGAFVGRCATSAMTTKPAASTDTNHHGKRARSRGSSAISVPNTGKGDLAVQGLARLINERARWAAVLGLGSSRIELVSSRSASLRWPMRDAYRPIRMNRNAFALPCVANQSAY